MPLPHPDCHLSSVLSTVLGYRVSSRSMSEEINNEWANELMQERWEAHLFPSCPSRYHLILDQRHGRSHLYPQMQHLSFGAFHAFITSLRWVYTSNWSSSLSKPHKWHQPLQGQCYKFFWGSWLILVVLPQDNFHISNEKWLSSPCLSPAPCSLPQLIWIPEHHLGVSGSQCPLELAEHLSPGSGDLYPTICNVSTTACNSFLLNFSVVSCSSCMGIDPS